MTIIEQDIIDLSHTIMADKRLVPVTFTPDERKALAVALNLTASDQQREFPKYARALRKLAKDVSSTYTLQEMWSVVVGVQSAHRRMVGVQRTLAVGVAWRLSDLIVTRSPGVKLDIEAGWGELA